MGDKTSVAVRGSIDMNESVSVDVRKINNGYITRTSRSGAEGYTSAEEYSEDKPSVGIKTKDDLPVEQQAGRDRMAAAKRALGRHR